MDITKIYKDAYTKKVASLFTTAAKGGVLLGKNTATALAIGLPVLTGVGGAYALSKLSDPTDTDLDNYQREAYIAELRSRLDRLKKLPKAEYASDENTLRI